MKKQLRLLVVEDSEDDAALLLREMHKAGMKVEHRRVWTAEDLAAALQAGPWDIVVSDWSMPRFSGLAAFSQVRKHDPDVPFIIVSGTIGEEVAIEALKAGVQDFMSKGRFARLLPAIERELREAEGRHQRRLAEEELARKRQETEHAERLLRQVVDTVPDGVAVVDAVGRFILWNPAAEHIVQTLSGRAEVGAEGHGLFAADQVTPIAPDESVLSRALGGHSVDGQEQFLRHAAEPRGIWLSVSARPLREADGRITGAVAVFRDVTRDKDTQEQLMIADRMASIGMLAAGVGHEINNPLAAVLANLDLATADLDAFAAGKVGDLGEIRAMLADALDATERVRLIVRDLKIFSRHQDEKGSGVELHAVLDSTLRMAWNEIRHRAELIKDYGEVPAVDGSESRLGQVFLNLVVNAAQAIPAGHAAEHRITVRTRLTDSGQVAVEVIDTGVGIPAHQLPLLFAPFYTTKPAGVGTGLGLAICHRIITESHGAIEVDSQVGKGTTFRVLLPVARQPQPAVARPVAPITSPVRRARVLVVDDEPLINSVMRRTLSAEHDVTTVTHGAEAVELLRQGKTFDVIFSDMMMPQMTGMELYAAVGAVAPDHLDRIVFLTGGAFTSAAHNFLQGIGNAQVEKPFDPLVLRGLVNERIR